MNYDNIIERRKVKKGKHSITLEVDMNEFNRVYDEYSNDIAGQIVNQHLSNNGDDGRATNISMEVPGSGSVIKISADVNYTGNDHTGYGIH